MLYKASIGSVNVLVIYSSIYNASLNKLTKSGSSLIIATDFVNINNYKKITYLNISLIFKSYFFDFSLLIKIIFGVQIKLCYC
jgi:hypothetical protein